MNEDYTYRHSNRKRPAQVVVPGSSTPRVAPTFGTFKRRWKAGDGSYHRRRRDALRRAPRTLPVLVTLT